MGSLYFTNSRQKSIYHLNWMQDNFHTKKKLLS
jgi:hypothetical protein